MSHDNDFSETFFAAERAAAKGHADYPLTREYIERLECVAQAVWQGCQHAHQQSLSSSYASNLYNALDAVNFLDESL